MRSDSTKLIQSGLLLTLLFLTACESDDKTSCIPATAPAPLAASTPAPVITSMGTDFFLTLPDHLCVSAPAICRNIPVTNKLTVAAATATTGDVTFNGVITPFSVAAGGQAVITLDPAVVLTSNELIEAKAIHVTSLAPVSVHVVSETYYSADGYLALPTAGLGTRYYVMAYSSTRYTGSEFAVVATQNNTTVTITPKADGATRKAINGAFTVMLNSGQTYQFANTAFADMTGSLVTADKPVAVFGGHRCADVPSATVNYCDYLVEQLSDVSIWGKTHHTALFSGRSRYTVRVLASQDGTTFTTAPTGMISTLNAGQFADVIMDVIMTGTGEFVSNNPVLVAQYVHGYTDDAAGKGDPSMVMVTPAEHGIADATFGVHGLPGTPINGAFMNVVTETAALANLKLDGAVVSPVFFTPVSGASIYSVGTIPISPGAHSLLGTVPYSALVYDYGVGSNMISYAYPVAATLSLPVPAPVTTPPPVNTPPAACMADVNAGGEQIHAHSGDGGNARNDIHIHHDDDGHHHDDGHHDDEGHHDDDDGLAHHT